MKKRILIFMLCVISLLGSVWFPNEVQAYSTEKKVLKQYMDGKSQTYLGNYDEYEQEEWEDYIPKATPIPVTEAVSDFTATVEDANQVKLKWTVKDTYDNKITHFQIYRSTQGGEQGTLIKTLQNTWELYRIQLFDEDGNPDDEWPGDYAQFTDTDVKMGITYYYMIRGVIEQNGYTSYGPFSNVVSACLTLDTPSVSIKAVNEHTATISFEGIAGAEYYEIERSKSDTDSFSLFAEIQAGDKLSYSDTSLSLGNSYYYRIRAYCIVDNDKIYSEYSLVKKIIPTLCAPIIKKAKVKNPTTLVISFGKVTKAQGYGLYKENAKTGKCKLVQTIKGNANTKFTIPKLKNGVTYSYKIAAYRKVKGKRLYGELSKKKSKTMDYYGYETESWESRYKRIFGNSGKYWYKSAQEASKHMTSISIKVWDLSGGKKIARTRYLTVHKNIAPTVKKMFDEIYKSKERFPIHDIGSYSWRGNNSTSQHCIGLAIDINANENCMVEDGKVLAGSFWKPKKNPYSIPKDSKLVKIMAKYGYFWGGNWYGKQDYMHFSYFGG